MKTILIILGLLFMHQSNAQFDGKWLLRLDNSSAKEYLVSVKQKSNDFSGRFDNNVHNGISGTYNEKTKRIVGYFTINRIQYKWEGFFKGIKKEMIIANYGRASGTLSKSMVMIKKESPNSEKSKNSIGFQKPLSADKMTIGNTYTPKYKLQKNEYSGKYRITLTNLYIHTIYGSDMDIFGSMGIRLLGQSKSGQVNIKPIGNKPNRTWRAPESNPILVKASTNSIQLEDPTGKQFNARGKSEIGKSREFTIDGELANDKLMVDIQIHLTNKRTIKNEEFGWVKRRLYVKDMTPNKEYLIQTKMASGKWISVGFKLEKL